MDPGAIITFHYRGVDAHDPQPIVLMLSRGYFRGKMHAINLKYIPSYLLKDIQDFVTNDPPIEGVHPRTYYKTKLKPFMHIVLEGKGISSYRAYNKLGISGLRVYMVSLSEADYK